MIVATLLLYVGILRLILGTTTFRRRLFAVLPVAVVVVVGGMLFGKYGATVFGLPWWIYYPIPAALTVVAVPVMFRLSLLRTLAYILLAGVSSPLIHLGFSFLLGWNEYMPFWPVRSLTAW